MKLMHYFKVDLVYISAVAVANTNPRLKPVV